MVPKARLLSLTITAVLLAAIVLAFNAAPSQAGAPVELNFWHAMSRSRGEKLNALVNRFNAKNPGIKVNAVFVGAANPKLGNDYNALYSKILENLARETPPDVSQVYENWTTQLIEIGALTPVDKFINGPDGMDKQSLNDFVPAFKNANTFTDETGSHLYTLPFNKSIYVLYYNKAIFHELGLKAPQTWQEMRAAAKTIATKKPGIAGISFLPNVDIFGHYLYTNGGQYITEDHQVAFGGALGIRDLNYWIDLVHTDRSAHASLDASKEFENGKAGMYIETTSRIGGFERAAKEKGLKFGVVPIPKGTVAAYQFAGTNLAIFSKSSPEKQQAAWKFIKFMTSTEITSDWAISTGYLPVRRSAINGKEYKSYIAQHPECAVGIKALDNATVQPRVPAWESIRGILDDAMLEALSRKYTSEDAIQKAVSLTNNLLNSITGSGSPR